MGLADSGVEELLRSDLIRLAQDLEVTTDMAMSDDTKHTDCHGTLL